METLKTQKFCNITVAASWAKVADRGKGRQASSQERAERVTAASILQAALSRATARPTPDGQATACVAERRVTSATTQPRSPAPGKQGRGHSCSVFMHVLCFNSPDSVFIHSFCVYSPDVLCFYSPDSARTAKGADPLRVGGVWPKVLDGIRRTMAEHSMASRPVQEPVRLGLSVATLREHSAPDGQRSGRRAPAAVTAAATVAVSRGAVALGSDDGRGGGCLRSDFTSQRCSG